MFFTNTGRNLVSTVLLEYLTLFRDHLRMIIFKTHANINHTNLIK